MSTDGSPLLRSVGGVVLFIEDASLKQGSFPVKWLDQQTGEENSINLSYIKQNRQSVPSYLNVQRQTVGIGMQRFYSYHDIYSIDTWK